MFEKAKEQYKDGEYKILVAKTIDQYMFCRTRNQITYTDFLNTPERAILEKILKEEHITNYVFYGVRQEADRSVLLFYPERFTQDMLKKNYSHIFQIIRIVLPNHMHYTHSEFLSGIMKLGIKREKFGDIVVTDSGADIICLKEVATYLQDGLKDLTRFRKSHISIEQIDAFKEHPTTFLEMHIIVNSIRLDNFVAELARCSRQKAKMYIQQGIVFVNGLPMEKEDKKLEMGDTITIRGKGKFIFDSIQRQTQAGKMVIIIKKYT